MDFSSWLTKANFAKVLTNLFKKSCIRPCSQLFYRGDILKEFVKINGKHLLRSSFIVKFLAFICKFTKKEHHSVEFR